MVSRVLQSSGQAMAGVGRYDGSRMLSWAHLVGVTLGAGIICVAGKSHSCLAVGGRTVTKHANKTSLWLTVIAPVCQPGPAGQLIK